MWLYSLYALIGAIITYFLYRKGRFNDVRKTENAILTVVGVIPPFVDMIQTLPAIEYGFEANPLINLTPPEYQLPFLVISHLGYSILALWLGWIGKSQEKWWARFGLAFFVILMMLIVVNNILAWESHGLL